MVKREKAKDNDSTTKKKRDCGQVEQEPKTGNASAEKKVTKSLQAVVPPVVAEGGESLSRASKRSNTERSAQLLSLSSQLRISSPTPPISSKPVTPPLKASVAVAPSATKAPSSSAPPAKSTSAKAPLPPAKAPPAKAPPAKAPSAKAPPAKAKACAGRESAVALHDDNNDDDHDDDNEIDNGSQQFVGVVRDLESALHHIADIGMNDDDDPLSKDAWVTFRVGDAGDASIIASFYRKSRETTLVDSPRKSDVSVSNATTATTTTTTTTPSSSTTAITTTTKAHSSPKEKKKTTATTTSTPEEAPLELWLADGLGDEDTPPSVHALLAYVHSHFSKTKADDEAKSKASSPVLGGVALLTLAWDDNHERVLRVEWFRVDPSLSCDDVLERKMWFRLSCIALLSSCHKLAVDEACCSTRSQNQNSK